jgi:hypothetical protein
LRPELRENKELDSEEIAALKRNPVWRLDKTG